MKTPKSLGAFLAALAALTATALYAQFDSGDYAPNNAGVIVRPLPQVASTDARYGVGAYPIYRPVLPAGEGREEVDAYCNTCHGPIYITMQPPLPADTWAAEVTKMEKTYGAEIPDDAAAKITRYLQTHYTPETRKR